MKSVFFWVFVAFIVAGCSAYAGERSEKEGYKAAEPIKRPPPRYPKTEAKRAHAGMVEIEFMVNDKGRVFEPVVVSSTNQKFEKEALY